MRSATVTFSIIIPSYNEGEDIRLSVESALNQTVRPLEILVVDDSKDKTPDIVSEYAPQGVRLIRGHSMGCCGARNLGIREAKGNIVVLLNADVQLPPDFLSRIAAHYSNGAHYVLVESRVMNKESAWARFIEAQHCYDSRRIGDSAEWTEGFSCRREAALRVGLIPGEYPLTFCRDWLLGKRLHDAGFRKVIDLSIIVPHKAPDNFRDFWRVRRARGRFGALFQYFLQKRSHLLLSGKFFLKDAFFLLKVLTLIPIFLKAARISRHSQKPISDFPNFLCALTLQETARLSGEWQGWKITLGRTR